MRTGVIAAMGMVLSLSLGSTDTSGMTVAEWRKIYGNNPAVSKGWASGALHTPALVGMQCKRDGKSDEFAAYMLDGVDPRMELWVALLAYLTEKMGCTIPGRLSDWR